MCIDKEPFAGGYRIFPRVPLEHLEALNQLVVFLSFQLLLPIMQGSGSLQGVAA